VFRENRGMFYFVEILDRVFGEGAEKIAETRMAIKTAFNAAQAGHAHWRSFYLLAETRLRRVGEQRLTSNSV
jgi:alkyl sulfatase BDS1-like metallo-beta-lactamase superfamily hydrolase